MYGSRLLWLFALSVGLAPLSALGAKSQSEEAPAWRVEIKSSPVSIKVGLAYGFTTTVMLPERCESVSVGSLIVQAKLDPQLFNKLILIPDFDQLGHKTNVTVVCKAGLRVLLEVEVVAKERSVQLIELVYDDESEARLKHAVENALSKERKQAKIEADRIRRKIRDEAHETLMHQMRLDFRSNDDVERARQNFVIVKVKNQIRIGDTGIILFRVHNRSGKPFEMDRVELVDRDESAVGGLGLFPKSVSVSSSEEERLALSFDYRNHLSPFSLIMHGSDGRSIEVKDIDF